MAGFLILAATLALMQPLADTPPLYPNAPDEHARFLVPWYICQHGVIPTGFEEEVRIPAYGFSYILYNAFPYIVQGYIMRFVSIFTSLADSFVCGKIGKCIFRCVHGMGGLAFGKETV